MNDRLAELQRQQQLAIRAALLEQLTPRWRLLDPRRLDETLPIWLSAVTPPVQDARTVSSQVAAIHIRLRRDAAGISGRAPVALAGAAPAEQVTTSLTVTSVVAVRDALRAGHPLTKAMNVAFVSSSGAATRLALQGGRQTVLDTVKADRHAVGWSRSTSAKPCAFCAMLASRGAIFRSETTADFRAHDHCSCVAVVEYDPGATRPTGDAAGWARLYQEHAEHASDQLNAFRRAYQARL